MASHSKKPHGSIHDFTVKNARCNDVDLSTCKGKVLLIVNAASQCGLTTSKYTELAQLYHKYKDQGRCLLFLKVYRYLHSAFPCNQFRGEEPGTNEEIVEFACTRFKADWMLMENTSPRYKFSKSSKCGLFGDIIKWNFAKFLVDKEGHVIDRYAPTTSPRDRERH